MKHSLKAALMGLVLMAAPASFAEEEKEDSGLPFDMDAGIDYPAPAPQIMNAKTREGQSLNGKWNVVIDEVGMGELGIFRAAYYANEKPKGPHDLVEYSFDERRQLTVPGDWNSQDPTLFRYHDTIWYQRSASIDKSRSKRYFLHIGGANYDAKAFVNGTPVGRHEGGYVAFNFEITDQVKDGDNDIIVSVNGHLNDSTVPTFRSSDFWKFGGITRDVTLIEVPETFVQSHHIYLADRETGLIKGWVQLNGEGADGQSVTVEVEELGLKLKAKADKTGRARFEAKADLTLWSPANPKLYDVQIESEDDQVADQIGFRSIETDGHIMRLNGEPLYLRGISMHEETILRDGVANTRADAEAQFALVKEMGANFVRLSHYPHNEYTVRLADEMGLLLWSEVPMVSNIDWQNEDTLRVAKAQVADNVSRDLNRASIIIWSIGNETFPANQHRLDFMSAEADVIDALDESDRLKSAALVGNPQKEFVEVGKRLLNRLILDSDVPFTTRAKLTAARGAMAVGIGVPDSGDDHAAHDNPDDESVWVTLDDPLGNVVDVVGYNEYFGWYYSSFFAGQLGVDAGIIRKHILELMSEIRFRNVFGKPMIITEFGAGAKYGERSEEKAIWSEDYQAEVYRRQIAMLALSEQVQGISPWILKDFRTAHRPLNYIQDFWNRKGLVSEKGEKKLAFEVLQSHYLERKAKEAK